jgi:hypothetical protein
MGAVFMIISAASAYMVLKGETKSIKA